MHEALCRSSGTTLDILHAERRAADPLSEHRVYWGKPPPLRPIGQLYPTTSKLLTARGIRRTARRPRPLAEGRRLQHPHLIDFQMYYSVYSVSCDFYALAVVVSSPIPAITVSTLPARFSDALVIPAAFP